MCGDDQRPSIAPVASRFVPSPGCILDGARRSEGASRVSAHDSAPGPATLPPSMRPVPGTVLGKYRLLRVVAEGGMGTVYEAVHEGLGTAVALKFLHPELARRPGFVERFLQEARVAARLKSPHIVPVTDVGEHGPGAYLVMELLSGESLQRRLERERRLPPSVAVDVAIQVLAGLSVAHAAGVVHRDLKPDNVFLAETPEGTRAVILDFGIAKLRDAPGGGMTRAGATLGTPEYMAPEQAHSADSVDVRADLYAVGVLLYEMLSGRRPATGDDPRQIAAFVTERRVTSLSAIDPSLPEGLVRVVHRAMDPAAEARFSSAEDMLRALVQHASVLSAAGHQAVASVLTPGPRSSRLPATLPPETPGDRTDERAPLVGAFSPAMTAKDAKDATADTFLAPPPPEAFTPASPGTAPRAASPPVASPRAEAFTPASPGIAPRAASPPVASPRAEAARPAPLGYPDSTQASYAPPRRRGPNPLVVGGLAAALGGVVVYLFASMVGGRGGDDPASPPATTTASVSPIATPPPTEATPPGTPPTPPTTPGVPPTTTTHPGVPTGTSVAPPPGSSAPPKDAGVPDAAPSQGLPFPPIPLPSGFPPIPSRLPPLPSSLPGIPPIVIPGFPQ